MNSPLAAFAAAQDAAFRASAALAAAMGTVRLYTTVPTNAPMPYVVRGADQAIPEQTECGVEAEVFATVTLWSKPPTTDAQAQARAMGAALIAAAEALTVAGWDLTLFEAQSESYATDPDGSTRGVLVFRYLLTEQAA